MKVAAFVYLRPATLGEAVAMLAAHEGDARPIAGGQSLLPIMAFRLSAPSILVDIARLPGLRNIEIGHDGITLGALVRWCDIERDRRLDAAHPLLAEAIRHVAHYQVRNRGTVGGSLAHADPAAELPGIAVACDAEIVIAGPGGQRTVPAAAFFTGALCTVLEPGELIVALRLPPWPVARRWGFREFSRRRGDFALAGAAIHYDRDGNGCIADPHIGIIGASDRPRRLGAVEAVLAGQMLDAGLIEQAAAAARDAVDPAGDLHGSGDYRRHLLGTMVERALDASFGRGGQA